MATSSAYGAGAAKGAPSALANITHTDDYQMWIGHQVVLSEGTAPNNMPTLVVSPTPDSPPETPTADGETPIKEQDDNTEPIEDDPQSLQFDRQVQIAVSNTQRCDGNPFDE